MNPTPLLDHLLGASLALAVFYAVYRLLLHHEPGCRFNRAYILAVVPLAAVLPWLQWPAARALPAALVLALPEVAAIPDATRPEQAGLHLEWRHAAALLYAAGAVAAAVRLAVQLVRVWRWRRRLPARRHAGYWLLPTGGRLPTFSFLNWLFWDETQPLTAIEKELVMAHEQAHIRQRHSADVLWLELGKIVFWFHPAVYALGRAQRAVHEYLADQAALRHGPPGAYLQLLARSLLHTLNLPLVQSFHPSSLRTRMKRIRESESAAPAVWKMVAGIASVAMIVAVYACRQQDGIGPPAANAVEQMPVYKGSDKGFQHEIMREVQYPATARKDAAQGQVMVAFTVTKDGRLADVELVRGVRPDLDREAIRAISTLRKGWLPALKNGRATDVKLQIPVHFVLNKKKVEGAADIHQTETIGAADANKIVVVGSAPPQPAPPDDVFVVVEEMPRFPGGIPGLGKHLSDNIRYPTEAREGNVQGKVFVQFVVREDGRITDVEVTSSGDASLVTEAMRVVKAMPNWQPGRQSGKAVPVRYVLPINFAL